MQLKHSYFPAARQSAPVFITLVAFTICGLLLVHTLSLQPAHAATLHEIRMAVLNEPGITEAEVFYDATNVTGDEHVTLFNAQHQVVEVETINPGNPLETIANPNPGTNIFTLALPNIVGQQHIRWNNTDVGFIEVQVPHPNRVAPTYRFYIQTRVAGIYRHIVVDRDNSSEYVKALIAKIAEQATNLSLREHEFINIGRAGVPLILFTLAGAILAHLVGGPLVGAFAVAAAAATLGTTYGLQFINAMEGFNAQYHNYVHAVRELAIALGQDPGPGMSDPQFTNIQQV